MFADGEFTGGAAWSVTIDRADIALTVSTSVYYFYIYISYILLILITQILFMKTWYLSYQYVLTFLQYIIVICNMCWLYSDR